MKAEGLVEGDVSQTEGNGSLKITKIHVDVRGEEVYNFEVEEDHNYYVSEAGVLVHNESGYEFSGKYKRLISQIYGDSYLAEGALNEEIQAFALGILSIHSEAANFAVFALSAYNREQEAAEYLENGGSRTLHKEIGKEMETDMNIAIEDLKGLETEILENYEHEKELIKKEFGDSPEGRRRLRDLQKEVAGIHKAVFNTRTKLQRRQIRLTASLNDKHISEFDLRDSIVNTGRALYGGEYANAIKAEFHRGEVLADTFEKGLTFDQIQEIGSLWLERGSEVLLMQTTEILPRTAIGLEFLRYSAAVRYRRHLADDNSLHSRVKIYENRVRAISPGATQTRDEKEAINSLVKQ